MGVREEYQHHRRKRQVSADKENRMRRQMTTAMILFSILVVLGLGARKTNTFAQSSGGRIQGTWRVQVTQRNCQTGSEIRSFPAMLTFADGGTLTGTTTAFPVALRGPDHGVWNHETDRSYRALSEAFIFNPAGAWISTQRITQAIDLSADANSFTSNAAVEFFDTGGNLTTAGCATAVATRMQ